MVTKNLATLFLLTLLLPLNLLAVSIACCFRCLFPGMRRTLPAGMKKTVLISGGKMTKALQLARSFHRAGHRVVLCETASYRLSGHRFSNAVDRFCTTPQPDSADYASALRTIVKDEGVDLYVPVCSPVSSLYDSRAIADLEDHCDVLHPRPQHLSVLDDKYKFARYADSLGLDAPKSFLITDPQQVLTFDFSGEQRNYILKSIAYDSVRRLDLTRLPCRSREETEAFVGGLPISSSNPWVMQEFIPGKEYCTHSTLRDGILKLHCCCESSPFQVNYRHIDDTDTEQWVRRLAADMNLSGQISLDFIRAIDDGKLYAIECNPRTHSAITTFHDHPGVADAYLDESDASTETLPLATSRPTYWLYHEVWRILCSLHHPVRAIDRALEVINGNEAIFDWRDPLPFLMVHHVQIPSLLIRDLRQRRGWVRIDFNIGKLVQLGGD